MSRLFTSESVFPGHPDKVCDQISDAILDAYLAQDPSSRVACETMISTGLVVVAGEVTSSGKLDVQDLVRSTIKAIGYNSQSSGFDPDNAVLISNLTKQSPDIARGVDSSDVKEMGAGDQGMMFGYACDQTKDFMPLPISIAHAISREVVKSRQNEGINYLRPDGKCQVTVEYDDAGKPIHIDTVVVSLQHEPFWNEKQESLKKIVVGSIIEPLCRPLFDDKTVCHVNPTGRFEVGGPHGDCGLTGRKIIVDTYGGYAPHGGGAFSGKDPSKVDRSAAYYARYVAKNMVAAGLARELLIQVSYAIGIAKPVSILVDSKGTSPLTNEALANIVNSKFDFRPQAIIDQLGLRTAGCYQQTAMFGHFGGKFPWEALDRASELA